MTTVVSIPGLGNSGAAHWQTLWEAQYGDWLRVNQAEWNLPKRTDWVAALDAAVAACKSPPILIAHSLGCILVAHWAAGARRDVLGALLVAPPDVESPERAPEAVRGFAPIPRNRLPFASIVVASTNDPYASIETAAGLAEAWGSRFADIGAAGHINADSGLGSWPQGLAFARTLGLRD